MTVAAGTVALNIIYERLLMMVFFTITAEILARSLANFHCQ